MYSRDFCFWLQGHFEMNPDQPITVEQVKVIQNHLALVFKHEIDPEMGDEMHQDILDAIHNDGITMPHFSNDNVPHSDHLIRC